MKTNKLIFSALPYVNNVPHLGNIIGCVLSSDVYTRYCRMRKINVLHICGTDEYGTACEIAADQQKTTPQFVCEKNYAIHKKIYDWFEIKFDFFGRTTCEEHSENTQKFYKKIEENGFIEEKEVEQHFCVNCKFFLADRYVFGNCPHCGAEDAKGDQCDSCGKIYKTEDLKNAKCSLCKAASVFQTTKHLYIKLGELKTEINKFVVNKKDAWSQNAKEISKEWLDKELHSRCITRDLKYKWGVPVLKEGYEKKVFYVWFDAPIGYFTFAQQLLRNGFESFVSDAEIVQFMGKDNVSFHSIFFPGMLIAAGVDFFADKINATEYLLFENKKFSKSNNHGIFGTDLLDDRLGVASVWRYYLIKSRPEHKDSNFTFEDFKNSVTGELINNLGNFVNRVLKFVTARMNSKVSYSSNDNEKIILKVEKICEDYLIKMDGIELKSGLKLILELCSIGNEYVQNAFNMPVEEKNHVFSVAVSIVYLVGHLVCPFMPAVSSSIFEMVALKEDFKGFVLIENGHVIGNKINRLFTPFSDEILKRLK